jgi:hypothetical protein
MIRTTMLGVIAISGIGTTAAQPIQLAQASAAAASFAALDANHDGKITVHEASANDEVFVAFKTLDANRDGELTPTEFAAYAPAKK